MTKRIVKDIVLPLCALLAALLLWQVVVWAASSKFSPIETVFEMANILKEEVFWRSLGATFLRALIAFIVSFTGALVLALISANGIFERVLSIAVTVLRSAPTMAVVLIFILTVSANVTTVLVGMLVLFPTFYSALLPTVKSVDKELIEIATVLGAGRIKRLIYVYLPSMAPAIVENGIAGLSLSIKLIVSAEVLAQTASSIGMMMQSARAYLELSRLLALTVLVILLCIAIDIIGKITLNKIFD